MNTFTRLSQIASCFLFIFLIIFDVNYAIDPLATMLNPNYDENHLLSGNQINESPTVVSRYQTLGVETETSNYFMRPEVSNNMQQQQQQQQQANQLDQEFDFASGGLSEAWKDKCKEIADKNSKTFDPSAIKNKEKELEKNMDEYEKNPPPELKRSPGMENVKSMKTRIIQAIVPSESKREKYLKDVKSSLVKFSENLKSGSKKRYHDFTYMVRCKPFQVFKLTIGVGLVIGSFFPPAAAGIAITSLVWAAVVATMDAADEPCIGGAAYIFVRTVIVQTGMALVGLPVDHGKAVAEASWHASNKALSEIGQIAGFADIFLGAEESYHFNSWKCSCGEMKGGECVPAEGKENNPLFNAKRFIKNKLRGDQGDGEGF
jgi:ElaB/YqjD/DUF883 family membrane-anchored ribosome-binding protein